MKNQTDLVMAVDYFDLVNFSEELYDENKIERFLARCAENGITTVQWRISCCGWLLQQNAAPDGIQSANKKKNSAKVMKKCEAILERFEPLEVAANFCRKLGVKILPWLTVYDDFSTLGEYASSFVRNYPEKCWKAYDGNDYFPGVVSYVYEDAVEFRLNQINKLLKFDVDGIYLSTRSHSRPPKYRKACKMFLEEHPGTTYRDFNHSFPNILKDETAKAVGFYGFDTPAVNEFMNEYNRQPTPEDHEWWNFRGGYFKRFLEKVKMEVRKINGELSFGLRDSSLKKEGVYPDGFFQWESLMNETIIDELHYTFPEVDCDLNEVFPEMLHNNSKCRCYSRLFLGITDDELFNLTMNKTLDALEKNLIQGIQFFEAVHFERNPAYWKLLSKYQ